MMRVQRSNVDDFVVGIVKVGKASDVFREQLAVFFPAEEGEDFQVRGYGFVGSQVEEEAGARILLDQQVLLGKGKIEQLNDSAIKFENQLEVISDVVEPNLGRSLGDGSQGNGQTVMACTQN